MHFVAMDGAKLTVLMIAGGIFSLAGILLMFRAKQEGSSARLELLGQKFEATSTGIVVFLIGAAFLAAPMFVPQLPSANAPPSDGSTSSKESSGGESNRPDQTVALPKAAGKEESEANDSISAANILNVGQTVRGKVRLGDVDWYAFAVDPNGHEFFHVVFRRLSSTSIDYTILDANEKVVEGNRLYQISTSIDVSIESDKYFILISPVVEAVNYELALSYR
jgi:hypothetical protein